MNCRTCQNNLSSFADGAMAERDRERMSAHIAECGTCRDQLDELIALKALLGGAPDPTPSRDFWRASMSRLTPLIVSRRKARLRVQRLRLAGAAFAAAIIGIAALQMPTATESDAPSVRSAPATFDPAALISLHAAVRATRPLADTGKIRYAIAEGNARDYANDARLETQ